MDGSVNIINWFEIYVEDIARAKKFYEAVFEMKMDEMDMMGMKMAFFPSQNGNGKVSGGLVQHEMRKPSQQGALVYFNCNPDMTATLARIEAAGGKITLAKTLIGDGMGFMALFTDSEGNGLGLHSMQ